MSTLRPGEAEKLEADHGAVTLAGGFANERTRTALGSQPWTRQLAGADGPTSRRQVRRPKEPMVKSKDHLVVNGFLNSLPFKGLRLKGFLYL